MHEKAGLRRRVGPVWRPRLSGGVPARKLVRSQKKFTSRRDMLQWAPDGSAAGRAGAKPVVAACMAAHVLVDTQHAVGSSRAAMACMQAVPIKKKIVQVRDMRRKSWEGRNPCLPHRGGIMGANHAKRLSAGPMRTIWPV